MKQPFTETLPIEYDPIIPAVYYSPEECEIYESGKEILKATEALSYVILFSSLICFKIVGL